MDGPCFLANPVASARALAEAFSQANGEDKTIVDRGSIVKIKNAWLEMYVNMVFELSRKKFAEIHAASNKEEFVPFLFVQVQDEVNIRIRSREKNHDNTNLSRRSTSSKLQQSVATVISGSFRQEIPTELEALRDKTANTLATMFEEMLRHTCDKFLLPQAPAGQAPGAQPTKRTRAATGAKAHPEIGTFANGSSSNFY